MLSRKESFESIKERLEYLQLSISNSGSLNLNDLAIHAENFFRDLLNLVYGWQLENANFGNQNAADIDLIDRGAKLAIQVTARNDRAKIADTLDSFYSKEDNDGYRFKFMLISREAVNYKPFTGHEERFDRAEDIIDIKRLLREINDFSVERLDEIAGFLEKEIKFPTSKSSQKFYPGPFLPDLKYFVGREELLANLGSTLQTHHKTSIHDISGLGKTFACYKFAADNQENYSKIFFVNCAKEAMMGSLASLGQMLNSGIEEAPQEQQATAFGNWLETNEDWLAIYDNVDLPFELVRYVPNQKKGDCIFTSNFADIADLGEEVNINKLGVDDSRYLLFNRKEGTRNEKPHFQDAREEEYFEKIVKEIDGLPLALSTTGAFIRKKKLKFREFWGRFEKKEKVIIENEDGTGVYQNGSALRAFLVALEENTTQKDGDLPGIAELINLVYEVASFISPDNIPEEFLRTILGMVEKSLPVEDADEYWQEARARLCDYDLLKMNQNGDNFSTHRLIQKTIQSQMPVEEIKSRSQSVLHFLTKFFPLYDYNNQAECERYYQHSLTALESADKAGLESEFSATLFFRIGSYQKYMGNYEQAIQFFQRSLKISRRVFGEEHHETAVSLNNLAGVYKDQGKYDEAIELYKQAIEIGEKTIGKEHPDYAARLNNLALVYDFQGKYDEAIKLYQGAIEIDEKIYGKEHQEYATDLNNLAVVYQTQGKYDEAI